MKISVALPTTGPSASPAAIAEAAFCAEAAGLDRVWTVDRLLRPADGSAYIGEHYRVTYDPLETLAWVAALTKTIGLGVSIVILPFQNVVVLARRLATLDQLSTSRVIIGVGLGHMPQEFATAGIAITERASRVEEGLIALKTIWGPDPVRFDGRFTQIGMSDIGPKPRQESGVPLIIGGNAPAALKRAGRHGLGINPLLADPEILRGQITTWREAAVGAGNDPSGLDVVVRTNLRVMEKGENGARRFGGWPRDLLVRDLQLLESIGVTEIFYELHDIDMPIDECVGELASLKGAI